MFTRLTFLMCLLASYASIAFAGNEYETLFLQNRGAYSREYGNFLNIAQKAFTAKDHEKIMIVFTVDSLEKAYKQKKDKIALKYSYAIPTDEALERIKKYGPILEVGAGTGYWAKLLRDRGSDILAFDDFSWPLGESWTPVEKGNEFVVSSYPDRNLFLCFPPNKTDFAYKVLSLFKGKYFIYIGEGRDGSTGDKNFFDLLESEYEVVDYAYLPTWPDQADMLKVFQRKTTMTDQDRTEARRPEQISHKQFIKNQFTLPVHERCRNCFHEKNDKPFFSCGGCKINIKYCGKECQKADWPRHKTEHK